jgi:hypothetical protein
MLIGSGILNRGSHDLFFIKFMKKNPPSTTLLDAGAGSGAFALLARENFPNMQVTALDPSAHLLSIIEDNAIRKAVGALPELNLDPTERFHFIHVNLVLHHIVGKTPSESRSIVEESVRALKNHLDDPGFNDQRRLCGDVCSSKPIENLLVLPTLVYQETECRAALPIPREGNRDTLLFSTGAAEDFRSLRLGVVRYKECDFPNSWLKRLLVLKKLERMLFIVRKAGCAGDDTGGCDYDFNQMWPSYCFCSPHPTLRGFICVVNSI